MKYLVMETHPAYAVLLDEEGRFLKAANLNYQVGDTVQNVVELRSPAHEKKKKYLIRQIAAVAAAAACFCLVFFGYYQPNFVAYGTIRIQINPEVEMTLSRTERVLDLKGLNADGEDLIREYDYSGKDREDVTHELIRRAMDMGYLSNGDSVSISIDSTDTEWKLTDGRGIRNADRYLYWRRCSAGSEQRGRIHTGGDTDSSGSGADAGSGSRRIGLQR